MLALVIPADEHKPAIIRDFPTSGPNLHPVALQAELGGVDSVRSNQSLRVYTRRPTATGLGVNRRARLLTSRLGFDDYGDGPIIICGVAGAGDAPAHPHVLKLARYLLGVAIPDTTSPTPRDGGA